MENNQHLALLGAGHWGKNLARNFHALGILHTLCDTNEKVLQSYDEQYAGVAKTADYKKVLEDRTITQIAIAAPVAMHYQLAKEALLAGKDVYVEKPLCLSIGDAEELIQLAKEQNKILMVGHLLQYHPIVTALKDLVSQGKLGKLHHIASHRLNLGLIRSEENNLWSFAPHDISVILSLLNDELPHSVRCIGQSCLSPSIPDMAMTTLEFSNQVQAHIYTSWLHPFKEQKLVVIGSEGMAVFDDLKPWNEKLIYYKQPVQWINGTTPQAQKTEGEPIAVPQQEPLLEECKHFLECCTARHNPKTNGEEGLRVLKILEAAQRSMDANGISLSTDQKKTYFSHPSAIVSQKTTVGAGTKIWHFSHIMDNAIIGPNCNIGQNVVISPEVVLGCNVKVQNNVSVYTGIICEDDVFLGPSMVFTNVINPRSAVNRRGDYQTTWVRKGASIGANATIVCGIELGAYSFIGAGAVVTKDVPAYALMVGNPARQIGWMSRHGERLDLPLCLPENEELSTSCPYTGDIYLLKGKTLSLETSELLSTSRV